MGRRRSLEPVGWRRRKTVCFVKLGGSISAVGDANDARLLHDRSGCDEPGMDPGFFNISAGIDGVGGFVVQLFDYPPLADTLGEGVPSRFYGNERALKCIRACTCTMVAKGSL